jgi:Rps23 Pro-64 3,4-dihydroxylase Tpa1-like proline 4-hydroxylase
MNLTPGWSVDWGGLLMFVDQDGHVAEAYTPAFNALNLFQVPQPHAVSMVAPFAGGDRLAITGWVRSKKP